MESNLYRYIIRRSLRHQLILIALIFVLASLNPWMLSLTKQIINKAVKQGDLEALLKLCGLFLAASRSPSPRKLNASTVRTTITTGSISHG